MRPRSSNPLLEGLVTRLLPVFHFVISAFLIRQHIMSILQGATHVAIQGGTQVATGAGSTITINQGGQGAVRSALKSLSEVAAHAALYDSASRLDAPRCHRNTRAKYRDGLERWMLGAGGEYEGKCLIWVHGGAGAGKSAIMQSVIERCAQHAVILGSFFFFRGDSSRNYAEVLIPTLAYQLARMFPDAMSVLEPIINHDPLIFKASLRTQAYELLVRPILYLIQIGIMENTSLCGRVFVIDGLDECSDPHKQASIINAIASILCEYNLPISFLIASRPELAISFAFQREKSLRGTFAIITLDDDDDAKSDIRQFIEDSFHDILDSHPWKKHIKLPWPDPDSIDSLVWKSSGHFIYAATAMKFIASLDEHPVRALEVVEGLQPSRTGSPFAQLDALYLHILTSANYSSQEIAAEDLELFLSDVRSLVSLSLYMDEMHIRPKHASLEDFFMDKERSQTLYISYTEYQASLLECYFQLLDNGPQASLFHFTYHDGYYLIGDLAEAIVHSRHPTLLQSLICRHSPQDIWNFVVESYALDVIGSLSHCREDFVESTCQYMNAICNSTVYQDSTLFSSQFEMYDWLMLEHIEELACTRPQYQMVSAIAFSSRPSQLKLAPNLFSFFEKKFGIKGYRDYFSYLTYPRFFEGLQHSPQSQLSWSSSMAIAMQLVLQQLVVLKWRPKPYSNSHRQWLKQHKPWKHTSLGSPRLSSVLLSRLSKLMRRVKWSIGYNPSKKYGYRDDPLRCWQLRRVAIQRAKCLALLKSVIFYLHKSDYTSEVAKLAQRSLPKTALMYPMIMKRARAKMDAYVCRWEESPDGLLEKARSLSINDMD
ncbi:hypothetical protein D9619_002232 [Psilocybe cf. subviscida]|uniref:Nephrocystin 3-like N-terminal domain-containing protein n=1 Tax=Psilocybe cf. subviscida TaxID=2480587 RepID=A0A8H5BCH9_9AGAR|nr:hypothetical protein D9619_002232 [Psilocybe cf. subviscida]